MLINLYILSLVLGAVLLGASLFLGEKRLDADEVHRRLEAAWAANCNLLMNTGPLPDGSIHAGDYLS